jgi:hypothetical protein
MRQVPTFLAIMLTLAPGPRAQSQSVYTPAEFIPVAGDSLKSRFQTAIEQGRRGESDTFWVAYEVPSRGATYSRSSDGITTVQSSGWDRTALFLLIQKSDGAVEKIRPVNFTPDLRVHDRPVYWLQEPSSEESAALLLTLARSSASTNVKKDAIFWLGQEISRQAGEDLEKLATTDPEVEVQKQVVFAISQRKNDESIPALQRIAKDHPNAAVRKQAIFWLSQKRDVRVLDFFEEMLRKQ